MPPHGTLSEPSFQMLQANWKDRCYANRATVSLLTSTRTAILGFGGLEMLEWLGVWQKKNNFNPVGTPGGP